MKKKTFGAIAILAITAIMAFNVTLDTPTSNAILSLSSIETIAYGENGDNVKDEKNEKRLQACDNGKNCECTICERGSTDCSPTCPCCK